MSEHDADAPLPDWLADASAEPVPADVLRRMLGTVEAEVQRRAEGETTRERAAAIAASLERTNRGTYGINVPRRPTVPHAEHRTG
ncbi:hypothetical protein DT076_06600 [Desertihabitans brevis]|uniref:Uncharacterized protein n=1 Tax=Desertihabitans brevis TaxID=2268447 RepID=A0A367YWW9_9ACTN|nr:hypothetical protein [Desertihabitans brevis]RCK70318.1 hypothetical protein DT076_06600 [Desertihabitans brevis]